MKLHEHIFTWAQGGTCNKSLRRKIEACQKFTFIVLFFENWTQPLFGFQSTYKYVNK